MPANQAPVLDNFLIYPDRVRMRGGFSRSADLSAYTPLSFAGGFGGYVGNSWLVLSRKTPATTSFDPWNCVFNRTGISSNTIEAGNTTLVYVDNAGTIGTKVVTKDQIPGPRWINFDGTLYGISYDASTAPTTGNDITNNYTAKLTNLLTFSGYGGSGVPPTPAALLNAPRGAFDIKAHQNRVWLLAGADTPGGSAVHSSTNLYFTNPIVAGGGTASADWKDPISNLTNLIRLDQNHDDFGVGLAVHRGTLLVFRNQSIWSVRGNNSIATSSGVYTPQVLSADIGCVDMRSIVECDKGVYFLSARGLMLTDGVRVINVSGSCKGVLRDALAKRFRLSNSTATWASCARSSMGLIIVSIGLESLSGDGTQQPIWTGTYDPDTNAWTRYTSQLWTGDNSNSQVQPGKFLSTIEPVGGLFVVGDKYATVLEDRNTGASFDTDIGGAAGLYDYVGVSTNKSIPARWVTRYHPSVGATTLTRKFGQAKRFFLDYVFSAESHLVPTTGWTISPIDPTGTALISPVSVPIGGTAVSGIPNPRIQRYNLDFTNEFSDLGYDITWTDSDRASVVQSRNNDIYGIGTEFQPTRDAR